MAFWEVSRLSDVSTKAVSIQCNTSATSSRRSRIDSLACEAGWLSGPGIALAAELVADNEQLVHVILVKAATRHALEAVRYECQSQLCAIASGDRSDLINVANALSIDQRFDGA